jgi:hypothetical protein
MVPSEPETHHWNQRQCIMKQILHDRLDCEPTVNFIEILQIKIRRYLEVSKVPAVKTEQRGTNNLGLQMKFIKVHRYDSTKYYRGLLLVARVHY